MKLRQCWKKKPPGWPEAAALVMILCDVLPCWLSKGAGWELAYTMAITGIGYLGLRACEAKHPE